MKQLHINEEEFKEYYLTHTYPEIQNKYNLTDYMVTKIAKKLNLSKPKGPKSINIVFDKLYRNKKNKEVYTYLYECINCTNMNYGQIMVVYKKGDMIFCREKEEFFEKFEKA